MANLKSILEAVLFCSNKPLPVKALDAVVKSAGENAKEEEMAATREFAKLKEKQIAEALEELQKDYAGREGGFTLTENAGGWQIVTSPDCSPWVRQLFPELKP